MTHCVKPMPLFLVKAGFTLVHPVTGVYMRVRDVYDSGDSRILALSVWSRALGKWGAIPSVWMHEEDRVMVLMSDKRSKSGARLRYDKPKPPAGE
ncbi:hypothetical protein CHIBITOTORO_00120 [Serratia phage vB_SmaM-ChibiTotoro]|nr:hypothetical protein CHIBITOTORO_00120 [Serratia phage vB_SmaM-ChibiTotoro]